MRQHPLNQLSKLHLYLLVLLCYFNKEYPENGKAQIQHLLIRKLSIAFGSKFFNKVLNSDLKLLSALNIYRLCLHLLLDSLQL